jgi:plastocyanin
MSRRTLFVLATAVVVTASTVGAGMALAGEDAAPRGPVGGGGAIQTRGTERIEPNELIYSTFHFSPEKAVVDSGQGLRFVHNDQAQEPHTATIVERADLPTDFMETFGCRVCNQALRAHFGGGALTRKVDVDGDGGLSAPGDSLFFGPGEDISRQVTARPNTKLFYLCAIHPWMQGKIVVN